MNALNCDSFVQREIICCLSALVSTLAQSAGSLTADDATRELKGLVDQASELFAPLQDFEEAALQAGWEPHGTEWRKTRTYGRLQFEGTVENLCIAEDIDPYEWEIFEHWAVTQWLADKLEAKGQRVDKDFAGMCVWGRTCSGQGISSDGVIQEIFSEMMVAK